MKELILKALARLKQFITYGIVGCINTLVDFAVFTAAGELLSLGVGLSQALGYSCGVICSFALNRRITFHGARPFWQQAALFAAVNVISAVCSSLLMELLESLGINRYLAKIAVVGVFTLFNFFAYKLVVFRDKK